MKINKIQIKNIIKEELQNLLDEFKAPDRVQSVPSPESMGFKVPEIDPQMMSKLKKDIVKSGMLDFVKKNFPFQELKMFSDLQESKKEKSFVPIEKTVDIDEIILQNARIMRSGRTWQNNFHTNLQALKAKLDDLPAFASSKQQTLKIAEHRKFLENWIKLFEIELAKTWVDRNLPTFKKFAKDNKEKLSPIFKKIEKFKKEYSELYTRLLVMGGSLLGMIVFGTILSVAIHLGAETPPAFPDPGGYNPDAGLLAKSLYWSGIAGSFFSYVALFSATVAPGIEDD